MDFNVIDQISLIWHISEVKVNYSGIVHRLFTDIMNVHGVIVIEFDVSTLVKLIKMSLHVTHSKAPIG